MVDLSPPITGLAGQIFKDTQTLSAYLESASLPPLSLAEDALPFFPGTGPAGIDPFPKPPQDIIALRNKLRQTCELLLNLVSTPSESFLWGIGTSHLYGGACLQFVYHFGIADAVPAGGQISFGDIASQTGVNEAQCTRILRTLMTNYIFHEPTPGWVSHTAMSKLMTSGLLKDSAGYLLEEGFIGAPKISETAERFSGSEERHHAAWNVAHQTNLPVFEFFETRPDRMTRFLGSMNTMAGANEYNVNHVANGYDWKGLGYGTVVDVGGSTGQLSIAIAKAAPQLNFVVQDLPTVVDAMNAQTQASPHERIRWEAHDFYKEQPIRTAAAYILRFILHDYSDKYASRILQALVPALGPQSKILVIDGVMPPPNTVTKPEERRARVMDMEMMLTYNAVERDLAGWKALFVKADKRLKLQNVVEPPGSAHSVMELVLDSATDTD